MQIVFLKVHMCCRGTVPFENGNNVLMHLAGAHFGMSLQIPEYAWPSHQRLTVNPAPVIPQDVRQYVEKVGKLQNSLASAHQKAIASLQAQVRDSLHEPGPVAGLKDSYLMPPPPARPTVTVPHHCTSSLLQLNALVASLAPLYRNLTNSSTYLLVTAGMLCDCVLLCLDLD